MPTEDEQIQRIIAEDRHKALVKGHTDTIESLNKISESLTQQNEQSVIIIKGLIQNQQKSVSEFTEALKEFPKLLAPPNVNVASPEVIINDNQEKVIISITELGEKIIEGQANIDRGLTELLIEARKPKKWIFTPKREFDRIANVTAEQIKL